MYLTIIAYCTRVSLICRMLAIECHLFAKNIKVYTDTHYLPMKGTKKNSSV